jgi:O-antigen ligase
MAIFLILLGITYFLGENSKISYFPSYLIGITGLGFLLFGQFNPIIRGTIVTSVMLVSLVGYFSIATLTISGDLNQSLLYLGYTLLILSFVYGLVHVCYTVDWFQNVFLATLVIAATVSAVYSTYFFFSLDYQPLSEKRLYAMGGLNNPVVSAISYGAALAICLSHLTLTKEKGLFFLTALLGIVLIVAIVLTGTRGVWLGLVVAGLTAVRLMPNKQLRRRFLLSLILMLPIAIAVSYMGGFIENILVRSTSFRPEIWHATISAWLQGNLFLGAGLQSTIDLYIAPNSFMHPHSLYLSTLYYGGIFGLVLLLTFIVRLLSILADHSCQEVRVYALPLLVFGLITLIFDGNRLIEKVDFLWLCFWLPVSLTLIAELKRDTATQ